MTSKERKQAMTLSKLASLLVFGGLILALAGCGGGSDAVGTGAASSANFDRAFIDAMVPHHESAIEMAQAAKEAGLDQPDLVAVADAILATQQVEIDQMKTWRGAWFGSSTIDPAGADALGLDENMMGMGGDAEALRSSSDVNTDFAQMMITHHQGAIEMAKLAETKAEHQELKGLAKEIIKAQEREIEIMRPHAGGTMNHG